MAQPTARFEAGVEEDDPIAEIQVKVYAMERGQTQILIKWPPGVRDDDQPGSQDRRKAFLEFVQSELEVIAR